MGADRVFLIIMGVVAAVLQLLLAPALTFGDATPGFIIVSTVCVILLFPDERHYVFAFVMGLVADLLGQSPVGATAFCLLLCAYVLPMAAETVGTDNIFMALLLIFAGMLVIEIAFCIFLAASGILGFVDGLVHVVFPCAIYNTALAFLVFFIMSRLVGKRSSGGSNMTMSNLRFN